MEYLNLGVCEHNCVTHALYEYSCRIYRNLSDVFIFVMNNKESYNTREQFYIHESYVLQYKVLHPKSQNKEYILWRVIS